MLVEEIKLVKYRDSGLHTYTYFWADSKHRVISPYFDTEHDAQQWIKEENERKQQ